MRTLITNGTIVTADGATAADVLIDGETISRIGVDLGADGLTVDETIDATGRLTPAARRVEGRVSDSPSVRPGWPALWQAELRSARAGREPRFLCAAREKFSCAREFFV